MIIPFLYGLVSPFRAPMTWAIIVVNLSVFLLTQLNMSAIQTRLEEIAENDQLVAIQGRIFADFILKEESRYPASYQKLAEEAMVSSDADKLKILGSLALRDSYFFSPEQIAKISTSSAAGADIVEKLWWAQKSEEILLIREAHSGYALGVTETRRSPMQWLTYQFVHSDEAHFFVNMAVFLVFGAALELVIGPLLLLFVFVASGIGAALVYLLIDNVSAIPLVGASGSVSGVVAVLCVLFWNHGVRNFFFLFIPAKGFTGFVYVPGWVLLALWMAADLSGFLGTPGELGGVAHSAHLGGELAGVVIALILLAVFKNFKADWRSQVDQHNGSKFLGPRLKIEII